MSCSCFTSNVALPSTADPDPTKHVNYVLGMVLGVDDFLQEHAFLSGRDEWMARDLIGYGTVRGLRVGEEVDSTKGPRLVVEPGVAVSPRGQMICVPSAQCAYFNEWLDAHRQNIIDRFGGTPPDTLSLYVVLCYRTCPTDEMPIPGEPCRSEGELMAPSRLTDDFCLELRFDPPNQREEDALRDFFDWIHLVDISDGAGSSTPLDQFLQAIRDAAQQWLLTQSPPLTSPPIDFMFGSPPASLHIRLADAEEYLRAAFRLWVTELRPKWFDRWRGCAPGPFPVGSPDDEECVLLAEVGLPILGNGPGAWETDDTNPVVIDETRRPYVLHLRMLQEWLFSVFRKGNYYEPGGQDIAVEDGGTGLSTVPGNGQLLIGNGTGYVISGLQGTAKRITVTPGPGTIKLNLPQNIATDSDVTFAGLTTTEALVSTGGRKIGVRSLTGPAAVTLDAKNHCVVCNTTGGAVTVTLPTTTRNTGRVYIIKRFGANDCTVKVTGADKIDGQAQIVMTAANKTSRLMIVADSALTSWHILSHG